MKEILRFIFNSIFAISYLISFLKDHSIALKNTFAEYGLDYHLSFGGRLKYLTYINLVIIHLFQFKLK